MLTQVALLTASSLRAAASRPASALTLILGAAVVAGVTTSMASLARGLYQEFADSGAPNRALVLPKGAEVIRGGLLSPEQVEFVYQVAGAAQGAYVDRIVIASARLLGKQGGRPEFVAVRAITPDGVNMRPDLRIVRGRMLEAGRLEAVAGVHATALFRDADIGDQILLDQGEIDIVGTFQSGDHLDSAFLVDADALFGRRCTAMTVDLGSPDAFDAFREALEGHSRLEYNVRRESEYYEEMAQLRSGDLREIGLLLGVIMAIGGIFCSTNVSIAAVTSRRSEIATLRAIGFPSATVAASILLETLAMVVLGAASGAAASWAFLDGALVREGGFSSTSFNPVFDGWSFGHGLLWVIAIMASGAAFAVRRALARPIGNDLAAID